MDQYGIGHLLDLDETEREALVTANTGMTAVGRQAEVDRLIAKANDPEDPYDGHHGNDRSEDSLAYARQVNPQFANHIENHMLVGDKGE